MKFIAPLIALSILVIAGGCPPPEEPAAPPREPVRPAPETQRPTPPAEPRETAEPRMDDQQLQQRITQRIQQDEMLSPSAQMISVQVNNGLVTLTGQVESQDESQRIEQMVEQIGGVEDVDNQLEIQDQQMPE